MMALYTYLPQDRLHALTRGESLPDRTTGSALFADISGFTALTEILRATLGSRQGGEELSRYLDMVYTALIHEVEKYNGSVINFAGDAITCWFDESNGPAALRTVCSAFGLQEAMKSFSAITLPDGNTTSLTLKIAVASGPVRRFMVGDPAVHYIDVLAGATVTRTAIAEHLANQGEVLVDEATVNELGNLLTITEWRTADSGEKFALAGYLSVSPDIQPLVTDSSNQNRSLAANELKVWMHSAVYERERSRKKVFLTDFRPCAVLFVRFTGIDYDADTAKKQLDTFIRQTQSIVESLEGVLMDITIGDKGSYVYVNFGALISHEDDAQRAVKAALAIKNKTDLQLQMGITNGVMRVGAYGGQTRQTFGALGDEVNLAARLMTNAAAGEILVSGAVERSNTHAFLFEPRPALILKGKAKPVTAFALKGKQQLRAIRLQEPNYALPMVGRAQELQLINTKLDMVLSANRQVIGIVAEAGMGKSRLVAEVIRIARQKEFVGYGGACQSDAVSIPYQAWRSIWQAFFEVEHKSSLKKQIENIEGRIKNHAPERMNAMPLLSAVLDLNIPDNDFTTNLEPQHRKSALWALLEDCLRAAAKDAPLLIVIEDLHWIDTLSYELLEQLTRDLSSSRICFVLAYRPPHLMRSEVPRMEFLPGFTRIELQELNDAEAEQVIRAKLVQLYPTRDSALPRELMEKLMARAQGNPFYLEELLNYIRDRGIDPANLSTIELPDSLHSLILSRIDQLSEREKNILRVASIIGRLFRARWLTGYYPELGDLNYVKSDLDQLAVMDITPLDTPEPELMYLFKHIVTHEVTYESLPFAARTQLHEQLAKYLEDTGATADMIAFHYGRSNNTAKKREYYLKAADLANMAGAFNVAVEYLTRLLDLTAKEDPTHASLALQLADAHYRLGNYPAARAAIEQAQTTATSDADHAAALVVLGDMTSQLGDHIGTQTLLEQAMPLARTSNDPLILCRALSVLGWVYSSQDKLDEAKAALNESLTLARRLGNLTRELSALTRLASLLEKQGHMEERQQLLDEIHTRAVAAGNRYWELTSLINLGVAANDRKEYLTARDYHQQALVLAHEIGAQNIIALNLLNLAFDNIQLGQPVVARSNLHEGLILALRLDATPLVVWAVLNFGYLVHAEGQTERALALIGLVRQQPVWNSEEQRVLDEILTEWALDPSVVEAGLKAGEALNWDETVLELIKE